MKKKGIGLGKKIVSFVLAFAMTVTAMPAGQLVSFADDTTVPFSVVESLFANQDSVNLGLTEAPGQEIVQVYEPTTDQNTFVNGVVMTEFNGTLYCQWQCSDLKEDDSDTWVAYSISNDNGATWKYAGALANDLNDSEYGDAYYSSGGWHVYDANGDGTDDTIVAYLNYWPDPDMDENMTSKGGYTCYTSSTDGINWNPIQRVKMADGSDLYGIFEQDPHVLDNGRIVNAAHFQTVDGEGGLLINPIYTDSKDGVTGWKKATFPTLTDAGATSSREFEPSMYVKSNGNLVMIFRDQENKSEGVYTYVLASESDDNGVTWSRPEETNLLDVKQKQSAGNLPDGTAYIVNCPTNTSGAANRFPLTITLSADGTTFTKSYVIGSETAEALGEIKYQADDVKNEDGSITEGASISKKREGYHYPKSVVIGNYLYISYAKNKEIAEYVRIPLESISLNDGWREYDEVSSTDSQYYMPYEMTYENTNGYIISRRGLAQGSKMSLGINTSSTNSKLYDTYNLQATDIHEGTTDSIFGEYMPNLGIDDLSSNNYWSGSLYFDTNENVINENVIWYIDGSNSGHIYCIVDGNRYYLCIDGDNVAIKTSITDATTWHFSWPSFEDGLGDGKLNAYKRIYTKDDTYTYYLQYTGGASETVDFNIQKVSNGTVPSDKASLGVYSLETITEYTSLSGELNYDIRVGTEIDLDEYINNLKAAAIISYKTVDNTNTDITSKTIQLNDVDVKCEWENGKTLDINTPGIYRLVVSYKANEEYKEVGVITVNVNDIWVEHITAIESEIEDYIYYSVNSGSEIRAGEEYVILHEKASTDDECDYNALGRDGNAISNAYMDISGLKKESGFEAFREYGIETEATEYHWNFKITSVEDSVYTGYIYYKDSSNATQYLAADTENSKLTISTDSYEWTWKSDESGNSKFIIYNDVDKVALYSQNTGNSDLSITNNVAFASFETIPMKKVVILRKVPVKYVYTPVDTMDANNRHGYVIAQAEAYDEGTTSIETFGWSESGDTIISNDIESGISQSGSSYVLNNVSENNLWFFELPEDATDSSVGYIYTQKDDVKYYFIADSDANITFNTSKELEHSLWKTTPRRIWNNTLLATQDSDDGSTQTYNREIKYMNDTFMLAGGYYLALMSKTAYEVSLSNFSLAITGEIEQTLYIGVDDISAEDVLSKVNLLYKDKTGEISTLDWDDPKVILEWVNGEVKNKEGSYTLNVRFADTGELIGTAKFDVVFTILHDKTDDSGAVITEQVQETTQNITYTGATNEYQLDLSEGFIEDNYSSIVKWSSDSTNVATVDNTGKVTFVGEGPVRITVEVIENQTLATESKQTSYVDFVLTRNDQTHTDISDTNYFPIAGQPGYVDIDKTATEQNYKNTGTAELELKISAIPENIPVDIILVMDVSRSMVGLGQRELDSSDKFVYTAKSENDTVKTKQDSSDLCIYNYDKLNYLRVSAVNFIERTLGGTNNQNRIALVQFADDATDANGNYYEINSRVLSEFKGTGDKDFLIELIENGVDTDNTYIGTDIYDVAYDSTYNTTDNKEYFDAAFDDEIATRTVGAGDGYKGYYFQNEFAEGEERYNALDEAEKALSKDNENPIGLTLSTMGGTNYGLAFKLAERIVDNDTLKGANRKKIVLFMTDGGPSVMNIDGDSLFAEGYTCTDGTNETKNGKYTSIESETVYDIRADQWANFALNRGLVAASRIEEKGYEIISLGYDLKNDNANYFYSYKSKEEGGAADTDYCYYNTDGTIKDGLNDSKVKIDTLAARQMVLQNVASKDDDYYEANKENLDAVYQEIAEDITNAVSDVDVEDVIGDNFELRILPWYVNGTDGDLETPKIEIAQYGKFTTVNEPIVHNFTTDGVDSDFFKIVGNLQSYQKDTDGDGNGDTLVNVTYEGLTLSKGLKFENNYQEGVPTSVTFTPNYDGKLKLVFGDLGGAATVGETAIAINDNKYVYDDNYCVECDVTAGKEIVITRGGAQPQPYLYYMELTPNVKELVETKEVVVETVEFTGSSLGSIKATSDVKGELATITAENLESYVLEGEYFTYDAGTKKFVYHIDKLAEGITYKIRYDAYLKGSNVTYEKQLGYITDENDRAPEALFETDFTYDELDYELDSSEDVLITKDENGNSILQVHGLWHDTAHGGINVDLSKIEDSVTISMNVKEDNNSTQTGYTTDAHAPVFSLVWENGTPDDSSDDGFLYVNAAGYAVINTTANKAGVVQPQVWHDPDTTEDDKSLFSDGEWKNLSVVIDSTGIYIYVEGELEKTITSMDSGSFVDLIDAIKYSDSIMFGSYTQDYWTYWDFNGYFDDVKIFDSALSADQVRNINRNVPSSTLLHDTNTLATATYVNINGDTCMQTYEVPQLPWTSGMVTYKFYLAKKTQDGTVVPIDNNAKIITGGVGDYVIVDSMSSVVDYSELNTTTADNPRGSTFAEQVELSDIVKDGIKNGTYDYVITTTVDGKEVPIGTYIIYQNSDGTYSEEILPYEGLDVGVLLEGDDGTASNSVIYFPITITNIATNKSDAVVLDYGLPVNIDLLANDSLGSVLSNVSLVSVRPLSETDGKLPVQSADLDSQLVDNERSSLNLNLEFYSANEYDVSGNTEWRDNTEIISRFNKVDSGRYEFSSDGQMLVVNNEKKTANQMLENEVFYVDKDILSNVSSRDFTFSSWILPWWGNNTIMYSEGNGRSLAIRLVHDDATNNAAKLDVEIKVDTYTNGDKNTKKSIQYNITSQKTIPYSEWAYVVVVYDNTTGLFTLYINGEKSSTDYVYQVDNVVDSSVYNAAIPSPFNSYEQKFYIGAKPEDEYLFNGWLDSIKFYSTALSTDDVTAIYTGTKTNYEGEWPCGTDGSEFRYDGAYYEAGGNTYAKAEGDYGLAQISQDDVEPWEQRDAHVDYTLNKMLDGDDDFMYALRYDYLDHSESNYVYGTLKVLPANSVYYEDNFADISFSNGEKVSTGEGNTGAKQYQTIIGSNAKNSQDFQLADMQGNDVVYGYDSNYLDNAKDSNDTVTEMGSMTIAKFTFTGTGFDIFSRTTTETGDVTVVITPVKESEEDNREKRILLHNLYYDDGELFQIPVISVDDLEYGKWTVQIQGRYPTDENGKTDRTGNVIFYLDGVRIYNPLGVAGNPDDDPNAALRDSYYAKGENNAVFEEIRNIMLGDNKVQLATYNADKTITISDDDYTTTEWLPIMEGDEDGKLYKAYQTATGWSDYLNRGPNNELYLSPNQAIVFQVKNLADVENRTLQVGAKNPNTETATMQIKVGETVLDPISINTKAELYYEITNQELENATQIVIANTGTETSGFISLTDLKINGYEIVDIFTMVTAENIPENYITTSENGVYSITKDAETEYRIYGTYNNGLGTVTTGWFICDEKGNLQGYQLAEDSEITPTVVAAAAQASVLSLNSVMELFETEIILPESQATVAGYSLSLEGNVAVNYYMDLSEDIISDEGAFVRFALADGSENIIPVSEAEERNIDGETYYFFSCEVAAKEMTDVITAQVVNGSGIASEEFAYSVKDYADYIIDNSTEFSSDMVALAKAMLNYGGYAQLYFEYNMDNLANDGLDIPVNDVLVSGYDYSEVGSIEGIEYYGASLVLESETAIKYYFELKEGSDISAYTFKCDDEVLDIVASGDYYYVVIDDIAAKELDDMFTISVTDGTDTLSVSYGPMTYAQDVLNSGTYGEALENTVRALFNYWKAAEQYFNSL